MPGCSSVDGFAIHAGKLVAGVGSFSMLLVAQQAGEGPVMHWNQTKQSSRSPKPWSISFSTKIVQCGQKSGHAVDGLQPIAPPRDPSRAHINSGTVKSWLRGGVIPSTRQNNMCTAAP